MACWWYNCLGKICLPCSALTCLCPWDFWLSPEEIYHKDKLTDRWETLCRTISCSKTRNIHSSLPRGWEASVKAFETANFLNYPASIVIVRLKKGYREKLTFSVQLKENNTVIYHRHRHSESGRVHHRSGIVTKLWFERNDDMKFCITGLER
jgi:hypothetical protein